MIFHIKLFELHTVQNSKIVLIISEPLSKKANFLRELVQSYCSHEAKLMGPFLNEKYNWTNKKRAFQLTTDCIKQNPANYTVWEYRRQIIKALNIELDSEFAWTSSIIARNIKNFQVWHHRQVGIRFSCYNDQSESEPPVSTRKRIFR